MKQIKFLIQSKNGHDEELIDLNAATDKVIDHLNEGKWAHVETNDGEVKTFTEPPKAEIGSAAMVATPSGIKSPDHLDEDDDDDEPTGKDEDETTDTGVEDKDWKGTFGNSKASIDKTVKDAKSVTITGKGKGG